MAAPSYTVDIVDSSNVSAPAGSVPTTSLPLSYLDLSLIPIAPMQCLFFYEFPHPTSHFMQTKLPILKHSLSLTLQYFFPLAAKLMCPPPPLEPYILYSDGSDSVPLVVAESTADVDRLVANYPRDIKLLHPFVPELPPSTMSSDGVLVLPIMAVKVTVFPNVGVCIGLAFNHVAADGSAFMHFVRCWSSLCKSNGDSTFLDDTSRRPFHNRDAFEDPNGCKEEALKSYRRWRENLGPTPTKEISSADRVCATFVLTLAQIAKLKQWLATQCKQLWISTFVATFSVMWRCLVKSEENVHAGVDTLRYILFMADCRIRTGFPLPVTYFGNCTAPCIVKARKGELMGANGILTAAEAIANKVKEMGSAALEEAQKGMSAMVEIVRSCHHIAGISWSPKFRAYDMDFGWGRPMKIEFVHVNACGCFSFIESRDEPGGIEVSLVLTKNRMDAFISNLAESLKPV
ncbi:hypothetical protein like AT1G03940 [Hibiscus trionum]|uniref:Uncharacterized protein n=1 Tax=Hibiscus trionum TaxID=183268 RepID=A0A9W7IR75_HIBTR|nr:hypothetical protein like AT1G03940 [Hibiscus trionum]